MTYERTGGTNLATIAKNIDDESFYIDSKYDAKGGTPTPATEEVTPGEKATKPTNDPTKTGYTFVGWIKTGDTQPYDYNTTVNEDINLDAKWNPINYKITYILNADDATNDSKNPSTYTVEDTINFQPPTRNGYDFLGWYEDEELTKQKDGIANETGDKTVYAKWQAKNDIPYKVEHYKENDEGKYELVVTDSLTGETGENVTATPKEFTGYQENTTISDRIPTGTIKPDGSLVLKLYYGKKEYKVTFDTKGGTPNPDQQNVKFQDKAIKPEDSKKDGNEFQYWYYENENGEEVQYNFDDPVTEDVHLIAKWTETPSTQPENENTITPSSKNDTTIAQKIIPNTGRVAGYILLGIIGLAIILGIRYIRIKNMMK